MLSRQNHSLQSLSHPQIKQKKGALLLHNVHL